MNIDSQRRVADITPLLDLLPEPCAFISANGVLQAMNAAWNDTFFDSKAGSTLQEACRDLFTIEADKWPFLEHEIHALLEGTIDTIRFDGLLTEPPERWYTSTIAAKKGLQNGLIWQLQDISPWRLTEEETSRVWDQVKDALANISEGFAIYDAQDKLVFCNQAYRNLYPMSTDLIIPGRSFEEIVRGSVKRQQYPLAPEEEEPWIQGRLTQHKNYQTVEVPLSGNRWLRSVDNPTRDGGTVCIRTDISSEKHAELLAKQHEEQADIIYAQAALLAELSTPLLRISEHVVVMPLIGTLDSNRASITIDTLLHAVESQRVDVAILDITGVPLVDTQIANLLIRCAQALRLLGASTVLTGIRPDVAQTIVSLGIDLSGVVTRADLMGGIAYALLRRSGKSK